ncbi:MAG TPA: sugar phosphate isomerase/epimerase [Pirellulales bacterium]|jgi:D-psicose/D-tagatose/L-ribulose 3-epimerase|nr:sugar phosphate isomerase/epimerase [Pirellulales bacterium]
MKYGMNLLLWSDHLHDGLLPALEKIKQIGYDGVEIPLFDLSLDYAAWGRRLDELGLERTAVTVRGSADNPISSDPKIRAAGIAASKRTLDCCQAVGAQLLVGPYHSAIGEFSGSGPTAEELQRGVESMREVAVHAKQAGVGLAVEYLNRFECYLLNTAADMARFIREVNHPSCRMMYDTFHANIEEKSPAEAIRTAAPLMALVHISENDRSTPGTGNIPWSATYDALREVNYDGWMVVEAFGLALPALVAATKIWRRMYQSEEQLARDALAFMRREVSKRWS